MSDSASTMHGYYAEQDVLPTFGDFRSTADLDRHARHRARLFSDKLNLPPRYFDGARLLEFGPDAGENSLVFARWGAECTLAEPHVRAHETIRRYFAQFELEDRLAALEGFDVESYPDPADGELFDVIDAEGFVNSIHPPSIWLDKLSGLLREDGLLIVFFEETFGSLFELTWKVVQARYRALTGADSRDSARALFEAKWDSIQHKRSIESWAMDVLENDFVRMRCFLEPVELCEAAQAAGLRLYSSWPRYEDGLRVSWFKHEPTADEELNDLREFVRRSRLSHMFGRRHFLVDADAALEQDLQRLFVDYDSLIDEFEPERAARCGNALAGVAEKLGSAAVLSSAEDRERSLTAVAMLRRLLELLDAGDPDAIRAFCNEDAAFIGNWGLPAHFAVFRRPRQDS